MVTIAVSAVAKTRMGLPGLRRYLTLSLTHRQIAICLTTICLASRGSGSNRRHPVYETGALPAELPRRAGDGIRTRSGLLGRQVLVQLSFTHVRSLIWTVVAEGPLTHLHHAPDPCSTGSQHQSDDQCDDHDVLLVPKLLSRNVIGVRQPGFEPGFFWSQTRRDGQTSLQAVVVGWLGRPTATHS